MMAYRYANIKKDLHGIAFKGRHASNSPTIAGAIALCLAASVCWGALVFRRYQVLPLPQATDSRADSSEWNSTTAQVKTGEGARDQPRQRLFSAPAGVDGRSCHDAPDR